MSAEEQRELLSRGLDVLLVALPLLVVLLAPRLFRLRSRPGRFCLSVVISWFAVEYYHGTFIQPLSFQLARERGDRLYDGTGAGAAIFFIGFMVPALIASLALGIEAIIQRHRTPPKDTPQSFRL